MPKRSPGRRPHSILGSPAALPALAVFLALGACSTGSPDTADAGPAATRGVEGCWALEVTAEGARADSVRSWLPAGEFPGMVELDSEPSADAGQDADWRAAYSWFDGRRETSPFSAWRSFADDSVLVQRPGAMQGMMLRLGRSDDALTGSVVGFTDVRTLGEQPTRRQAPVRGTPTACP